MQATSGDSMVNLIASRWLGFNVWSKNSKSFMGSLLDTSDMPNRTRISGVSAGSDLSPDYRNISIRIDNKRMALALFAPIIVIFSSCSRVFSILGKGTSDTKHAK